MNNIMKNPFIPNTISYTMFEGLRSGKSFTIPQMQRKFGIKWDQAVYIVRRDSWLYEHDAKPKKKTTASATKSRKRSAQNQIGLLKDEEVQTTSKRSAFTITTKFKMRNIKDISQIKMRKQIGNTEQWLESQNEN